jgi:hypothetical protein
MQHQEEGGRRKGREGFLDALERQIEMRQSYLRALCQQIIPRTPKNAGTEHSGFKYSAEEKWRIG